MRVIISLVLILTTILLLALCWFNSNVSYIHAINSYHFNLDKNNDTRADMFLNYISYEMVKEKIFYWLIDSSMESEHEDFKLAIIKENHPDTYNFILSLRDNLSDIGDYML